MAIKPNINPLYEPTEKVAIWWKNREYEYPEISEIANNYNVIDLNKITNTEIRDLLLSEDSESIRKILLAFAIEGIFMFKTPVGKRWRKHMMFIIKLSTLDFSDGADFEKRYSEMCKFLKGD